MKETEHQEMTHKIIYFVFSVLLYFPLLLFPQIKEEQEKNEMLKDKNEITYASENNAISVIEALEDKYNGIGEIINDIKPKITDKENIVSKKKKELDKIDQSGSFVSVRGVVESRVSEYAIINSNGSLYAIKSNLKPGNSFNGTIKYNGHNVTYNKPNGYSVAVSTYIIVDEENPRDKYQKLSSEINTLEIERKNFLKELKEKALGIIEKEIKVQDELIIENHYALGEEYFNKQDFENAYKEFEIVKNINENYKDVKTKIESSNNKNSVVKKSSVYKIVSLKANNFIIGTSEGVYESTDGGKIWRFLASEGFKIVNIDATEDRVLMAHPTKGIFLGKRNKNDAFNWYPIIIKYKIEYAKVNRKDGSSYFSREYDIVQPDFAVAKLHLFKYHRDDIILIEFEGRSGLKEKGNKQYEIQENSVWDYLYIPFGGEWVRVPEKFISPDDGNSWIGYWGALLVGDLYYSSLKSQMETENLIEKAKEQLDPPDDAFDNVKDYLSDIKNVEEEKIEIIDYSLIQKETQSDDDPVLVLTNYGLFKTCRDCESIEEIELPVTKNEPISICLDKTDQKIILIGYQGGGLRTTMNNGKNWKEI